MSAPNLILKNMRGSCANVGTTVHTLFRFNGTSGRLPKATGDTVSADDVAEAIKAMSSTIEKI